MRGVLVPGSYFAETGPTINNVRQGTFPWLIQSKCTLLQKYDYSKNVVEFKNYFWSTWYYIQNGISSNDLSQVLDTYLITNIIIGNKRSDSNARQSGKTPIEMEPILYYIYWYRYRNKHRVCFETSNKQPHKLPLVLVRFTCWDFM